ncbi:MAG: PepSY domain-containing protein [Pseudomonadota bacterium]
MLIKATAAAVSILALCQGAALAQSSSTSGKNDQSLPQEIKQKLSSQGFTNVEVVPGSYLVSAKDKDGDPVSMIIGPHSMTMFSVVQQGSAAGKQGSSSGKQGTR